MSPGRHNCREKDSPAHVSRLHNQFMSRKNMCTSTKANHDSPGTVQSPHIFLETVMSKHSPVQPSDQFLQMVSFLSSPQSIDCCTCDMQRQYNATPCGQDESRESRDSWGLALASGKSIHVSLLSAEPTKGLAVQTA